MTCFLTSSPCIPGTPVLNPANGFLDELRAALPSPCPALFVCSSPDEPERTEAFAASVAESFAAAGAPFSSLNILDRRTQPGAAALVREARLIVLAGGHVPTQNRFFNEIGLRELMAGFSGVVLGISAGTMNSAATVYAQPELPGETAADFPRFLPGLGLTETMVIPHYQMIRDAVLDGLRLFEDVTCSDSRGRCFYALVDGSYLLIRDGREELRGEAWRIRDGVTERISREGDILYLA